MNIITGISTAKESESFTRMSRPRDYVYTKKKSHYVLTTAVFEWPSEHFSRMDQHFHFVIAIILHFTSCDSCDCDDAFFILISTYFSIPLIPSCHSHFLELLCQEGDAKSGRNCCVCNNNFLYFHFSCFSAEVGAFVAAFFSPLPISAALYTRHRHVLCRNQNLVLYKRWKSCYVPSSVLHGVCVCCRECRNEIKWRAAQEKSTGENGKIVGLNELYSRNC